MVDDCLADDLRSAGLRYTSNAKPGIRRELRGSSFHYISPDGHKIGDAATLERISKLAIPPAWTDVWISADPRGHLQATGRDAKGRLQPRYHARWREFRDSAKYDQLISFAESLGALRAAISSDISRPGMGREKVTAAVVRLLDTGKVRVGNAEYAKQNKTFGATTLRNRHASVNGATIRLRFRGKRGVQHDVNITDRRVARIVLRCQELPGEDLFEFIADDGSVHTVRSEDVNDYIRDKTGEDFTAKVFRTWRGTVAAYEYLSHLEEESEKGGVVDAVKTVAALLGNTPAICRKCYIHPAVSEAYLAGDLDRLSARPFRMAGLTESERRTLTLLKRSQKLATG